MQYRKLGNTDEELSLIGLGTMTWGEQNTQAEAFQQMDMALANGVNFFDAAEMYPIPPKPETQGQTEAILGNWLAARGCREKIFLATKITGREGRNAGLSHIRGGARLNREHVFKAVDSSLKRLQTDYIDLYQVHWPERATNFFGRLGYEHQEDDGVSIEETLSALTELVQQGKIRHIGLSNETPWGVMEYMRLAREKNLARIQSIQNPYNLLNRTAEIGLTEMCIREQISFLAYSPLAFGKLTGKYLNGAQPEGARLTLYSRFARYDKVNAEEAITAYVALANEHGISPADFALAFVNTRDFTGSNIIGATNLEQLQANINSVDVALSEDILAAIADIHARYPNPSP